MAKKSKAQLKRLMERAAARGETYIAPQGEGDEGNDTSPSKKPNGAETSNDDANDKKNRRDTNTGGDIQQKEAKRKAAIQLKKELAEILSNEGLKAKERRSAKRKAEAIAVEASGCASADELLKWYEANGGGDQQDKNYQKEEQNNETKRSNPYIVFVGQLSYDTTKEKLFRHFQRQLQDDNHHAVVTEENVKIRLLTDPKTKKSRGMAFVEVHDDPELLYSCLKLHHTHLDGRRINVERSAGGGKNSESRKAKLQQFREEQVKHMEETVDAVLEEYYQRGEIKEKGELDEGVISLCKRHSAAVVQAALERYVESNGRDMDNPSAYLTFLIGKLAEGGICNDREKEKGKGAKASSRRATKRKEGGGRFPNSHDAKRSKKSNNSSKSTFANSEFAKQGIDMEAAQENDSDPQHIFPSLARRGRGRGYM